MIRKNRNTHKRINIKESTSATTYKLIDYFDVWGNEEDGWDVNNLTTVEDSIVISDDATDREIFDYLKNTIGFFSRNAKFSDIAIDDYGDGFIEFSDASTGEPLGRLEEVR